MKPYRFSTESFMTKTNPFCTVRGTVFADTLEEAKRKVEYSYGVDADIYEYDNDIIEDRG